MPLSLSAAVALVGSLEFASCLWMVFGSMTDVITNNNGICATGSPYQVTPGHQCSSGSMVLIEVGGPGLFVFGAIATVGVLGLLGPRGVGHLLLMGTLVFGLLGWNFLHLRASGDGTDAGNVFCGVLFLLMAAGGLIGLWPILGLRWPRADSARDTRRPLLVGARLRQQLYWAAFATGTLAGAFLGSAIVDSLV